MKLLVGDTGLVGTSLSEQTHFDRFYNSKNFQTILNMSDGHDLYLACLPATKWLVNKDVARDLDNIDYIVRTLSKLKYNSVTLISTIDIYNGENLGSNENDFPVISNYNYGSNRYLFEVLAKEKLTYNSLKIFRLPALFNKHIKKNIVYDLLNNNNVDQINVNSAYQWFNLDSLNYYIEFFTRHYKNDTVFNLFPAPLETSRVLELFPYKEYTNGNRIEYNYKTKYTNTDYLYSKDVSFNQLEKFINEARSN